MKVKSAFQFQSATKIKGKVTQEEVELCSLIHKQRADQFPVVHHKLIPLQVYDHLISVRPSMDAAQLELTQGRSKTDPAVKVSIYTYIHTHIHTFIHK